MYLKALEIQGFKSFPEKTTLSFKKDITAIVGPNGSGKSNISDAIMWVMGEQRSKALRGGKMEDVIFGGTEKRNPMGYAQVSLLLDNSEKTFDIDAPEVMLTRRYYRSGESEYYINRESVRRKDLTELLMDTGLGRFGYSIIGQGRISEIVSAKSTDRREIFEEAAGISRYRYRKEESERRLHQTDENLLRINDKIGELELQVVPLRQQAETAKKYLVLRDELRGLEISVWMENLDRLHAQAATVEADCEEAKANLEKAHKEQNELYAQAENFSEKMRESDIETENLRSMLSRTEAVAAECESAAAVLRANLANNLQSIERIKSDLKEQEDRARELDDGVAAHRERIERIDERKVLLETDMRAVLRCGEENAAEDDEIQKQLTQLVLRESEKNEELTRSRTMLTMLADSAQELMDREAGYESEKNQTLEKQAEARLRLREDKKALAEADEKVTALTNVIAGFRLRMAGREETVRELADKKTKLTIDGRSMDSRISMLTEMEKELEGFSGAVKTVMREASRGTVRGIHGPVANLVKVEDKYALAIETALGGAMQNIVVDTPEDGKNAIEFLKRRGAGRGTFLPISAIKGNVLTDVPVNEAGYLGIAYDLISADFKYSNIFKNLLGRTVVTETLGDAVRIAKKCGNRFRIVSLDGQLINAGGSMTGGSAAKGTGILSRANELKKLTGQRKVIAEQAEKCSALLAEAERELSAVKYEMQVSETELENARETQAKCRVNVSAGETLMDSIVAALDNLEDEKENAARRLEENKKRVEETRAQAQELESQLEKLRGEIAELTRDREEYRQRRESLEAQLTEIRTSIASLAAEREATLRTIEQMLSIKNDLVGGNDQREENIAGIQERNRDLTEELKTREERLKELAANIAEIKSSIESAMAVRLELEGKRTRAEKAGQEKNRELLELERICSRFEQKKIAADMEEKQIIDRLWESYELSRTAAQAQRQPVENLQKTTKRIGELKRSIASLGNPNLGAIDEYARVSERYDFLTEQRDDVEKSKREIQKIISDITKEMKEIFVREFKAIDECFRKTFLELFGGGKAALVLEDEDNVLDCGIEIKVQPPGKALSNISLMSGGEMAFVAIALYFAILKVRPTPFCVMDEIEAALDEANVIRYAEYMRTMTARTQFIVITHRRGTMEEADMLYGVTMQEKGVSKILELDLEEAQKSIE